MCVVCNVIVCVRAGCAVAYEGDQIIGLFDSHLEALAAANQRFLRQSFLIHQVQTREPVYNVGYVEVCPV